MTGDILEGKWKQLRGSIKKAWGELTDDELDQIGGHRDKLAGKLQEKYGYTKERAEMEITRVLRDLDDAEENYRRASRDTDL
jgi:uncharacterized protein YjbJ (UPF0337 family)